MIARPGEKEHWAFDKKIPIAVVVMAVAQFFGAWWYIGKMDGRIDELERRQTRTENTLITSQAEIRSIDLRLARMEESQRSMYEILRRLERLSDRRAGVDDNPGRP